MGSSPKRGYDSPLFAPKTRLTTSAHLTHPSVLSMHPRPYWPGDVPSPPVWGALPSSENGIKRGIGRIKGGIDIWILIGENTHDSMDGPIWEVRLNGSGNNL